MLPHKYVWCRYEWILSHQIHYKMLYRTKSTIYWSLCLCCTLCKKTNLQKRTKLYVCSVYVRTYTVTWVLLKRQGVRKLILQLQSTQFYIQSQLKNTLFVYIAHKKLAEASVQSDSFSLLQFSTWAYENWEKVQSTKLNSASIPRRETIIYFYTQKLLTNPRRLVFYVTKRTEPNYIHTLPDLPETYDLLY